MYRTPNYIKLYTLKESYLQPIYIFICIFKDTDIEEKNAYCLHTSLANKHNHKRKNNRTHNATVLIVKLTVMEEKQYLNMSFLM